MTARATFDPKAYLTASGVVGVVKAFERGVPVFAQGDPCNHVFYIQTGGVKVSVLSRSGREAVIAMLGPGDFFGEGCLAGQKLRISSAITVAASLIMPIDSDKMVRLLHKRHELSDRFIEHLLARNIRIEEDLIDHLFNSSEKRLARTLLLLARYNEHHQIRNVPPISQEALAKMVGTTRSRVNYFMGRFERLGFINQEHGLRVNNSLLTVVLYD